jgi:hypothetical protein
VASREFSDPDSLKASPSRRTLVISDTQISGEDHVAVSPGEVVEGSATALAVLESLLVVLNVGLVGAKGDSPRHQ